MKPAQSEIEVLKEELRLIKAQEPVSKVSEETFSSDGTSDIITHNLPIGTKLYAAPVATQVVMHDTDHSEDVRAMVVPDGYKLVPIEPTAAQCFTAAFNLCNEFGDEFVRDNKQFAMAAYSSLVAASQSAKGNL